MNFYNLYFKAEELEYWIPVKTMGTTVKKIVEAALEENLIVPEEKQYLQYINETNEEEYLKTTK